MSRGIMSYHKSSCSSVKVRLIHNDSDKTCLFHALKNKNRLLKNRGGDFASHQTADSKPLLFASYWGRNLFSVTCQ